MATIKDIANKVGVNVSTVSRVLNNRGYISDSLRENILKAMEELNYQPNEVARTLFRKKSNMIGLIIPTVDHPFFSELCNHIENYAYQHQFKVLLCNSQHDKEKELMYLNFLKAQQVEGIIMGSHTIDVEEFSKIDLPLVTFERAISDKIPFVSSDNYAGGRLATEHLLAKGCKKIAMITGSLGLPMLSNERHSAFKDVAQKHGVWHTVLETDIFGFNPENYEGVIRQLFDLYPDIDGIFASSDVIAAHILKTCYMMNKSVPDDVKVVGYDGISFSKVLVPPLTTVVQPIKQMAELALDLLMKQINKEPVQYTNILPNELIVRQTT
ncbi:LacI family DNA-binding transcriptional regulator [Paenibacillus senegalensis]|uniref:LacI family DNA-binding transcriptional regulator n=1 Tax=Paenibacillus senegalensis TaxID=1465766 RepID=UPI00028A16AD|nr:LacI family DNA-binding transcriptional regulator [Paenibacillus senegalensis]